MHSRGFNEMTHLYRHFMQFIAILPFDGCDYTSLATRALLVFFLGGCIVNSCNSVSYIMGSPSVDQICEALVTLGYSARYCLLLRYRQKVSDLVKNCRQVWDELCANDEDDRQTVRRFESKVRVLFKVLLGTYVFATLLYTITAINLTLKARRNNDTQTKYLLFEWFVEGGEDIWPGYKINFLLELIIGLSGGIVLTSVDTTGPLFIMIGAGYFRTLRNRLSRTYDIAILENDDEVADRELVACSRLHQRILAYCIKIDEITRSLFFVQLLTTVYNLSLIGIKLAGMDQDKYKYVMVALLNIGQLFLCQWAPDHLIQESTAISTAAYSVSYPWMRRRIGKILVLMIARAQRPVQMTAAGVVHLSLETFGEMLKGAVSFFTVLRSFTV